MCAAALCKLMWPLLQASDSSTSSLREAEKLPDLPSTSLRPGLYYLTEQRGVGNSQLPIKKEQSILTY